MLDAAWEEMDINACRKALASIRTLKSTWEELNPEYVAVILDAMSTDEFECTLDDLEFENCDELFDEACINDTSLAQPGYVVSVELEGHWLVNDHGDFAAYNVWVSDPADLSKAINEYKEYVMQYTNITENGETFSFLNDSGETCQVVISSTSKSAMFQVRVPRFE